MKNVCLVLFFGLTLAVCGSAAHAQVVTPVPAPTIIKTAPYTINRPGYYQLGADLTLASSSAGAIITINASNVTLDFGGHYISGPSNAPGTKLSGVIANERGNLTIRNGAITFCYQGIQLVGNGNDNSLNINQRIDNMLVSYCYYIGVNLYASSNSEVTDCRVSYIGGSTVSVGTYGLYFGSDAGVCNQASGNTVTRLSASGNNKFYGIYGDSRGMSITNNLVGYLTQSDTGGYGYSYGIYTTAASFATGNRVFAIDTGIYGAHCQNNLVTAAFSATYVNCVDGGNNH